jgi:hypothetical protein
MRRRGIWKEIYIETEREREKGKEGEKESEREKYRERGRERERERENILWGDGCASLDPSRRTRGVPGGCGWP